MDGSELYRELGAPTRENDRREESVPRAPSPPGLVSARIAACGNDCASCPRYVAHPFEKSPEELRRTAELWMEVGYRDRVVPNEEIACAGCKPENRCRYGIAECCAGKGVGTCAECAEHPCDTTRECLRVTESFEPACRRACSEGEYELLRRAFFEKEENLARARPASQ